jgi:TIR domain
VRVFFCHASEDKGVVDQVFQRVAATYPDVKGWLDRFEIVGGDDLVEKLAAGIEEAEKFLVFISERSVDKPWVRAELRKALMAEIEGIKPEFIVPVKLGTVSKFPPFIESKYYIDLETKTETEWLREIYAAISGVPAASGPDAQDNLRVVAERTVDDPDALAVVFEARYWAEPVAFLVETAVPILERQYQLLPPQKGGALNYALQEAEQKYSVVLPDKRIGPAQSFAMLMKFAPGTDLDSVITRVDRWDGSGSTQSGIAFLSS